MIQNYKQYTDELKKLNAERKVHSTALREIGEKRDVILRKLVRDSYSYMIEQFSQKLERGTKPDLLSVFNKKLEITTNCFLLNDEIGIFVYPHLETSTIINLRIIYIKDSKVKFSDKSFEWQYSGGGITIDRFIDVVMEALDMIYKYRKEAELKRTAKKYNL